MSKLNFTDEVFPVGSIKYPRGGKGNDEEIFFRLILQADALSEKMHAAKLAGKME